MMRWYDVMLATAERLLPDAAAALQEWENVKLGTGLGTSDWLGWADYIDMERYWPWPWAPGSGPTNESVSIYPPTQPSPTLPAVDDGTPVVYMHWGFSDELLYVGSSVAFNRRQQSHRRSSAWWPEVEEVSVEVLPDAISMRERESNLIAAEAPIYNIVGQQ